MTISRIIRQWPSLTTFIDVTLLKSIHSVAITSPILCKVYSPPCQQPEFSFLDLWPITNTLCISRSLALKYKGLDIGLKSSRERATFLIYIKLWRSMWRRRQEHFHMRMITRVCDLCCHGQFTGPWVTHRHTEGLTWCICVPRSLLTHQWWPSQIDSAQQVSLLAALHRGVFFSP